MRNANCAGFPDALRLRAALLVRSILQTQKKYVFCTAAVETAHHERKRGYIHVRSGIIITAQLAILGESGELYSLLREAIARRRSQTLRRKVCTVVF